MLNELINNTCLECGGEIIQNVCHSCGLCTEEIIFAQGENNLRKSYNEHPERIHHEAVIGVINTQLGIYSERNVKYQKLNKLSKIISLSNEWLVSKLINETLDLFQLPTYIKENTYQLVMKSRKNGLKGKKILEFIAASIHLSYEINQQPYLTKLLINELNTKGFNFEVKKVIRTKKEIMKLIPRELYIKKQLIPYNQISSDLGINQEEIKKIEVITEKARKKISGKTLETIIAPIVYYTLKGRKTQREICEYFDITEATLRSTQKIMNKYLKVNQLNIN